MKMKTKNTPPYEEPKVETRMVRHYYSDPEKQELGGSLARTISEKRGVEIEFDQVKASFKARLAESEARIDCVTTNLMNGFDMRNKRCVVVYDPPNRVKRYYLEGFAHSEPVLTEDMTEDDFQREIPL